ncbi:hypothetical protein [Microcoleus asticus]|uniref:hypothetical protein n=1 Tax=Microcoleus asticus TaxID=2815231 RepID=UPI001C130953|nr:hypothetical protein [Microcoleus asticus]
MASTSEQQRQQAIARYDFPSKFRPAFPKKPSSSRGWSIVYLDSLGFASSGSTAASSTPRLSRTAKIIIFYPFAKTIFLLIATTTEFVPN